MADQDSDQEQCRESLESTMMSDDNQLCSSEITSQRVGHFEHRLLWNSDESTQVICPILLYRESNVWQLPARGCMGMLGLFKKKVGVCL